MSPEITSTFRCSSDCLWAQYSLCDSALWLLELPEFGNEAFHVHQFQIVKNSVQKLQITALVHEREPKLVLVNPNMPGYNLWQFRSVLRRHLAVPAAGVGTSKRGWDIERGRRSGQLSQTCHKPVGESEPSPQLKSLQLLCVSGNQTHNANVGVNCQYCKPHFPERALWTTWGEPQALIFLKQLKKLCFRTHVLVGFVYVTAKCFAKSILLEKYNF